MFFEQTDVNFAAYADDNTPYFCGKNLEVLLSKLQICALKLFNGFQIIIWKWILTSVTLFLVRVMKIRKQNLTERLSQQYTQIQKLLGVHIDYKLKFDTHIESLCKKVGKTSWLYPNYKVYVYKPSTTINEKFYNVAIQLLCTYLDVS